MAQLSGVWLAGKQAIPLIAGPLTIVLTTGKCLQNFQKLEMENMKLLNRHRTVNVNTFNQTRPTTILQYISTDFSKGLLP